MHLQRADHFRFVSRVQPRRSHRIDRDEPRIERIMPQLLYLLPQGFPHRRIGRRRVTQPIEERSHIEPCAAHHQREAAISIETLDLLDRLTAIQARIKRFIRIGKIDQPMEYPLALFHGRLICPDIHPTIDLPGICRKHLCLERFRHLDRDATLAHSGRSDHDHDRLAANLCLGKTAGRLRWDSHHVHPTRPNSLASSSVERRNAVRRPCGQVMINPSSTQSCVSC